VPEEQALDLGERQDADDLPAALGEQVTRAMPEAALEDRAPAGAMEERRLAAVLDECLPARRILGHEVPYADRRHGLCAYAVC
jgi:hypothetical protein